MDKYGLDVISYSSSYMTFQKLKGSACHNTDEKQSSADKVRCLSFIDLKRWRFGEILPEVIIILEGEYIIPKK